jgi:ATP-binding cassette subfamily C (CFTR/MRP) protein 1
MEGQQKLLESLSIEEPLAKPMKPRKHAKSATSNVPSGFWFFWWVVPLLRLSKQTPLEQSDLPDLREQEKVYSHNLKYWPRRLIRGLLSHYKYEVGVMLFLSILSAVLIFFLPAYIIYLEDYLQSGRPDWEGYVSIVVVISLYLLYVTINVQLSFRQQLLSLHFKTGLLNLIYQKALRIVPKISVGNPLNILQVDAARIYESLPWMGTLLVCPVQIAISVYFLVKTDGVAGLLGTGFLLLMMGMFSFLYKFVTKLNDKILAAKDDRMKETNELFNNIKFLKFFAWEQALLGRLLAARQTEMKRWRAYYHFYSIIIFGLWIVPVATAVTIFLYYSLVMHLHLTSATAFVTLSILSILQEPIRQLPSAVNSAIQVAASGKRVEEFLEGDEVTHQATLQPQGAVEMREASFAFHEEAILKDITLTVKEGELVGLVGQVGSGKSALITALMGEMKLTKGQFGVKGSIAYASGMEAWILNATLRDNVTFQKPYDAKKFAEVIQVCSLENDLALLPNRELTEIGEKGINLSGGQKARVALARAVYADADIYLLDDPLSSVDAHVGAHIFTQCICTYLKGKTIILSTHAPQFITQFDRVFQLQSGCIVNSKRSEAVQEVINKPIVQEAKVADFTEKLIVEEDREYGSVSSSVYLTYFNYSGGKVVAVSAAAVMTIWQSLTVASNIFLEKSGDRDDMYCIVMYCTLGLLGSVFIYFRCLILLLSGVKASVALHDKAVKALVRAPVNLFYDVTPIGRIFNRFTKDMDEIDSNLAFCIGSALVSSTGLLGTTAICLIYAPWVVTIVPIVATCSILAQQLFLAGQREASRLNRISRSPLVSHFSTTMAGVQSIRGFQAGISFQEINSKLLDENNQAQFFQVSAELWLSNLMNYLSLLVFSFIAIYFVVFKASISPGVTYLCMTYVSTLASSINYTIRCYAWVETSMVAVERLNAMTEVPQEAPDETPVDRTDADWPRHPRIKFCEVVVKYRPNTPEILKGLDFEVNSGEKIGIVGRTGSGKSTLTLALFRIVELHKGCILIDGEDISRLGLHKLRKALSIIPQEPVLFRGSLRFNLDPFDEYSDEALRTVLSRVSFSASLDSPVEEGGSNFSSGERQLICVARAALKDSKILVLDEATAAIDRTSDELIQRYIRERFASCTVLTIAHRLNTILDSDKVLVMQDGRALEFGAPKELLSDPRSLFASLHSQTTSH